MHSGSVTLIFSNVEILVAYISATSLLKLVTNTLQAFLSKGTPYISIKEQNLRNSDTHTQNKRRVAEESLKISYIFNALLELTNLISTPPQLLNGYSASLLIRKTGLIPAVVVSF